MKKFDVVVIGSGPGGYVAAIRAAQLGFSVACIDKRKEPGGTCLNIGCIPSKALLASSELYAQMKNEAPSFGIHTEGVSFSLSEMMERKKKIVTSFQEGVLTLFKKQKITFINGIAKILTPQKVQVLGEEIEATHIILATGSVPLTLPFLPLDEKRVVSSTGALEFSSVPKRLLIVGAGIIGVELGSVYSRLGSKVEFVEFLDRICPTLDVALSKELQALLTQQGMTFHLSSKVTGADFSSSDITLRIGEKSLPGDAVLVAIGRKPYTENLGLENVGLTPGPKGCIPVDGAFRTKIPSIFAIGDLIEGPMLAHKASEEGACVAEIIAGLKPVLNYLTLPNVVYTNPEVASVGFSEEEAQAWKLSYTAATFPFKTNSRAKCTGETEGFVKILAEKETDRVIGVHILGAHASELIAEAAVALQNRMTAFELGKTPHAHPTLSETLKEAALHLHKQAIHR